MKLQFARQTAELFRVCVSFFFFFLILFSRPVHRGALNAPGFSDQGVKAAEGRSGEKIARAR